MFKQLFVSIAIVLLIFGILLTGLGGILDISSANIQITKEHAWNDGSFLVIVAIALLLLSKA